MIQEQAEQAEQANIQEHQAQLIQEHPVQLIQEQRNIQGTSGV
jgi:hypothetical protein